MKSKYKFVTTPQRSRIMRRIKSTNTTPEITLRKELWSLGYRYRVNYKKLNGNPDIVFIKKRVVIFVDGEFWHGYKWEEKKIKIKNNRDYWIPKIERNMERDKKIYEELTKEGWKVIRFWEHEIKSDIEGCTKKVESLIK